MQIIDPNTNKAFEVKNEFVQRKQTWGGTKEGTGDKARISYETINGEHFSLKFGK